MIKKALTLLAVVVMAITAKAADEGSWTIFPSIGTSFETVVETPARVYMLSGGHLYHLDPADNEFYAYNSLNKLSDNSTIDNIYYDPSSRCLAVTYSTGNIDLIYDNGSVVNMADIKDAILTTSHSINDVAFGFGRLYAATEFGIVVFDLERHEVIESGIFNENVQSLAVIGQELILLVKGEGSKSYFYGAPYTGRHNTLDKFTMYREIFGVDKIVGINQREALFLRDIDGKPNLFKATFDTNNKDVSYYPQNRVVTAPLSRTSTGVMTQDEASYIYFGPDGKLNTVSMSATVGSGQAFMGSSPASMWVNTDRGVGHYNFSGSTPSVLMEPFRPEAFTTPAATIAYWSPDGNRLYLGNQASSFILSIAPWEGFEKQAYINVVENGSIIDKSMYSGVESPTPTYSVYCKGGAMLGGLTSVAEDPSNPDRIYAANNCGGVFVIEDGKVVGNILRSTVGISPSFGERIYFVGFDPEGNLWVNCGHTESGESPYAMLPAAKVSNIANTKASDWIKITALDSWEMNRHNITLFDAATGMGIFSDSGWGRGLALYNSNGTWGRVSDDKAQVFNSFQDTEGNSVTFYYTQAAVFDHNSKIWVGTDRGLFVIENPAAAVGAGSTLAVKRPIVARNDGTGLGDYLCDSECVYSIAVDPTNRKWIATANSGVYLVSADGSTIIRKLTTDNSMLPSNCVYTVSCDPHSNKVYFGTAAGIVAYDSDASPAAEDYSEVYAYPNPVRPDYTGWISVCGLMDNSLVKITDVAGNILAQGRSEGGMFAWDGCGPDGARVRSGVYLVMASQNSSGSSGVVTKIMVVN